MNFIISADTDIGLKKNTNQDGLSLKVVNTPQGRMVFAILCDGMGGLDQGEVASASVIRAFDEWVRIRLPEITIEPIEDITIRMEWDKIVQEQNQLLHQYGGTRGMRLGTTAVVMLLTQNRYYILNVGDSRAYEIKNTITQLTKDQTFVHREVEMGRMTPQQAELDPRRSVLLQSIGASDAVYPDMFFGETKQNAVYMLCSDGFRHELAQDEIMQEFAPENMLDEYGMKQKARKLINLNMERQEQDNISVALIRTF